MPAPTTWYRPTFPGNPAAPAAFTARGRVPGQSGGHDHHGRGAGQQQRADSGRHGARRAEQSADLERADRDHPAERADRCARHFTVPTAPVGYVKVLVDGSTATRPNVTFPTLDYDLVTVAGQVNTVGLPIYLPALSNNRLCVTETTGGGTLTMVEAPGFSLTFAPGAGDVPRRLEERAASSATPGEYRQSADGAGLRAAAALPGDDPAGGRALQSAGADFDAECGRAAAARGDRDVLVRSRYQRVRGDRDGRGERGRGGDLVEPGSREC